MAGRAIMRRTILQALGRIDDDGALREVAEEICRIKPTARHVAAIVRDYRGVKRSPDVLALANKIIADINDYAYRYPEVSTDDMKSALHCPSRRRQTLQGTKTTTEDNRRPRTRPCRSLTER